jgi:alpha-tubulin suppressor-like RCC1 family protein
MLKDIILNTRKTIPPPPVYFNELWGTGQQLYPIGDDSNINRSSPVQVGTDTDWSSVFSGRVSFAIKSNGSLWSWGNNDYGQLGTDSPTILIRSSPVQVGTLMNWKKVSAGDAHVIALKTDGTIWSWGRNDQGYLGINDVINRSSPVQIGNNTDWIDISRMSAIKSDGTLWVWGYNLGGELGLSYRGDEFNKISINRSFSVFTSGELTGLAISFDGKLWSWGNNANGELGLNDTIVRSSAEQVGIDTNWSKITAGIRHTLGIKTDGTLWSWGANIRGQLGINDTASRSIPTQVGTNTNWSKFSAGSSFTIAIRSDGTMWSWGNNANGELGLLISSTNHRSSPVQIGTRSDWTQVACGHEHSIALRSDGTMWSWGRNTVRQLGFTTTFNAARSSPIQIGVLSNWTQVSAGGSNSAAIRSDGTLWAWGLNTVGQVGINNTLNVSSPVQVGTRSDWTQVSIRSSTLAIRSDGTFWGWGDNFAGQLGLLDSINRSSPVQIGTLSNWVSASNLGLVNMAMDNSGKIYTAGGSQNALSRIVYDSINRSSPVQLGEETNWKSFFGSFYSVVQKTNGSVWTIRSFPVQIGTDTDWKNLSIGGDLESTSVTKIGVKNNGTLWAWGANTSGILGLGDTTQRNVPTQVGTDTNWSTNTEIISNNVTAIKTNGTLWAWGLNSAGQLGLGDTINRSSPTQVGTLSTWVSASQYSVINHYIKRYT